MRVPALSSFLSPLHTAPARIKACALARVSASPRSTKSASRRFFGVSALSRPRRALGGGAAQRRERGLGDMASIQPRLLILSRRRVVIDEAIRQDHRPHFEAVIEHPRIGEVVQYVAAEAADRAFLDSDQHLVLARQALDQLAIQ